MNSVRKAIFRTVLILLSGPMTRDISGLCGTSRDNIVVMYRGIHKIIQVASRRQAGESPRSVHKYVTGVSERSQRRVSLKDDVYIYLFKIP